MPAPITAAPGSAVTIPNMVPTQTYNGTVYTFDGWATTPSGGNRLYRPGSTITLNNNITLYAQWIVSGSMPVPTPTPPGGIMGDEDDPDAIIDNGVGIQAVPDKPNEQPKSGNGIYPTTVYVYKYNNASWKDQLSAIETYTVNANGVVSLTNTQSYTYDSMGNPINYNGVSLTWQGKQLKSHTTTNGYMTTALHFAYDENGLRTQKTVSGFTTNYYYNGTVLIGMQKGNITQRFSYDSSGKVVSVNYNGTDYYYLRNAQGDIVKLIDNNSNTVVEYTYDSWGKILSTTGSKAATLGTDQPFRYRGYVYDNETGWYYLQSRYYDPSTNRFISSDILLSTGQGVLGHDSYAYCLNNPVKYFDSNGKIGILTAILIGVVVGAVASVAANGVANVTDDDPETEFFTDAGWAALEGGISGALTASPVGIVGQVVGNAAISGGCNLIKQAVRPERIDWGDVGINAAGGAIGGDGATYQKNVKYFEVGTFVVKHSYKQTRYTVRKIAGKRLAVSFGKALVYSLFRAQMHNLLHGFNGRFDLEH